jgi:hypothetical protein
VQLKFSLSEVGYIIGATAGRRTAGLTGRLLELNRKLMSAILHDLAMPYSAA